MSRLVSLGRGPSLVGLRLRRFKCFADSGPLQLAPVTLIFGRNNTGKSSLIQSVLLLRQSLESFESGPRLNLRGPLYPAGAFSDIVFEHRVSTSVCFDLKIASGRASAEFHFEFTSDEPRAPRLSRLEIVSARSRIEIKRGRGSGGPYELWANGKRAGRERREFSTARFLPAFSFPQRPAVDAADTWLKRLRRVLVDTRAIGPFRQQPERRYEFQGRPPDTPDILGEYAIDALIDDETRRGGGVLLREINRWLKPLARAQVLPLRNTSRTGRLYEVRLKNLDTGRWANFADVGSGIGQALPIMIEGLRTQRGGTFIVQEPESHLHPDAQLAIADFLIYLAQHGRSIIAETHSELILLRIRRRYLETRNARRRVPDVRVLVVGDAAKVRQLEIDDLGRVRNWPAGFLEDATEERLALLEEVASAAERGEG